MKGTTAQVTKATKQADVKGKTSEGKQLEVALGNYAENKARHTARCARFLYHSALVRLSFDSSFSCLIDSTRI